MLLGKGLLMVRERGEQEPLTWKEFVEMAKGKVLKGDRMRMKQSTKGTGDTGRLSVESEV